MKIEAQALRENVPGLLTLFEQACQQHKIPRQTCLDLQLAVEEACINVIEHGYADLQPGTIAITFKIKDRQVSITITDFGHEFDPTKYPPPDLTSDWDQRPVGGLGVYLITKLMDAVRYTSDPVQGNRLELTKNIEQE